MALMVFSDKMIDGVAEIDDQHRTMIAIINQLYEIALKRENHLSLVDVFDGLDDYTANHFALEERLFAEHGYPELVEHAAKHQELARALADYRKRQSKGQDVLVALDLLHFLKQWLTQHMMADDKKACAYLNARGVF